MKKIGLVLIGFGLLLFGCQNVLTSPPTDSTYARDVQDAARGVANGPSAAPGIASLTAGSFFGGSAQGGTRTLFADVLKSQIDAGAKLFILDVRDPAAFAAKHIPGAVNIPLATLFRPENLATLPTDGTPIVTVCVTGHTASMAMSALGTLGYNAYALRFGMMGWNAATSMKFWSNLQEPQTVNGLGENLPINSAFSQTPMTPPVVSPVVLKRVAASANEFFGGDAQGGTRTIFADALASRIESGERLFILDVRDPAAYETRHIPGAVNIPLAVLFQPKNLAKIPRDGTPIVTVCVTGHMASMAMSALGTFGYNAYVLRFGMMGWNPTTSMKFWSNGQPTQIVFGLDGPFVTGPNP